MQKSTFLSRTTLTVAVCRIEPNPDIEDTSTAPMKCVEREHMQFIAENLLAYVVIFQQLVLRFCRIDLASPKMSLMLFRLTKVLKIVYFKKYLLFYFFLVTRCLVSQI